MSILDGGRPAHGPLRRLSAALTVILTASLALLGPLPAAADEAVEVPGGAATELPFFLQGVDLALPSQEAFRDWPATELLTRPYWLPWSWLSFQRASLFDRPVFLVLTVGWSASAQAMSAGTLADPRVLAALNSGWTGVLVDADRRPDVRERYQTGSWPVIAFLLPNGRPMLSQANESGTAMPITTSAIDSETLLFLLGEGRLYFDKWREVLEEVGGVWAEREGGYEPEPGVVDAGTSDEVARWLLAHADRQGGGIGLAPKFVISAFAEYAALRDARLLPALMEHARLTLLRITESPLYDVSDGGVRRMAAEPDWKAVQPEKMLDKNAHFLRDALFVLRTRQTAELEEALAETARFMIEALRGPGGGFYLGIKAPVEGSGEAAEVEPLILAGPSSLAGAALLRVGAWLDDRSLADAGIEALELTLNGAYHRGRGVDHVIEARGGARRYLETQADVALAFIDAFETTGEDRWLRASRDIVDFSLANLRPPGEAALIDYLPDAAPIGILANPRRPLRPNTRLARAMLRLSIHGQGVAYGDEARRILESFSGSLVEYGVHSVESALAVEEMIREPLIVTISGGGEGAAALRRAAINLPWGWTVVATAPTEAGETAAAAEIVWRGSSVRVGTPAELDAEVRQLTGLGPG
jgi:uncharacterized protein YyaL (SSP411 family)